MVFLNLNMYTIHELLGSCIFFVRIMRCLLNLFIVRLFNCLTLDP